jgi:hypothetical protein
VQAYGRDAATQTWSSLLKANLRGSALDVDLSADGGRVAVASMRGHYDADANRFAIVLRAGGTIEASVPASRRSDRATRTTSASRGLVRTTKGSRPADGVEHRVCAQPPPRVAQRDDRLHFDGDVAGQLRRTDRGAAQRPRSSPYTSMMRSEKPLTTSG